jgi:hypothetical protein
MHAVADPPRFQGSLAVVLDNGLELTIPNELLVVPQKLIDDSGKVQINTTYSEVLLRPTLGNDAADIPMIGKQFFSSTYLFVDHDTGTFTVWQANNTRETRLISVGGNCDLTESEESPASSSPTGNPPQATDDTPPSALGTDDDALTTGTIVGIAVGAASSLVALAIIIYICFVRRKKRKSRTEKSLLSDNDARYGNPDHPYGGFDARHELHNVATSELNAAENPKELPSGKEASELDCVQSKHAYKSPTSTHMVYELGTRSP